MTSAPCQQCPYCGLLWPAGCVECGAPHCTAPRLCVISCRKPSGHQPQLAVPGRGRAVAAEEDRGQPAAVVDVGRALALARGAHHGLAQPVLLRAAGEAVGQHHHVAGPGVADRAADRGRDRGEVVGVGGAGAGQLDDLDVHVLRAAARAHVHAQGLGAAVLGGQEALDDRDVGLDRVAPAGEAVRAVGGVRVDELELRLADRQRGVGRCCRRSSRCRTTSSAGRRCVALRLGGDDDLGQAHVLQLSARVGVGQLVRVLGGQRERRQREHAEGENGSTDGGEADHRAPGDRPGARALKPLWSGRARVRCPSGPRARSAQG